MRDFVHKFDSGEYLREFRGFSPFWAGCFYGSSVCLGGEEKYSHCFDFFSGIGDVEWWITSELDKLSNEEKDHLESIMARNKWFDDEIKTSKKIKHLSNYFNVDTSVLYRMGNESLYTLFKVLNDTFNDIIEQNTKTIIDNPTYDFGAFGAFMREEFSEEMETVNPPTVQKRCHLFNYPETPVYAKVLPELKTS